MGCCNQNKATYSDEIDADHRGMAKVMFKGNKAILLYGDITGRMYVFRKNKDILWVDKRDIPGIKEISMLQVL